MPERLSNYRAPYVENAASTTSSSAAATIGAVGDEKEDGDVRLRRRAAGEPYCNAVVGGIPVRMAEWRGSRGR